MPSTERHRQHPRRGRRGRSRGPSRSAGFTLVELLVVVAMGGLVFSGAVLILVSHLRTSARLATLQHLRDHCGWVQFLINREIEQAQAAAGGGSTLTLAVPGFSRPVTITYTRNAAGELQRIGPGIDAAGRLEVPEDPDEPYEARTDLVARDVLAFSVNVATNSRAPRYSLTLGNADGVSYTIDQDSGGGAAYCRARQITRLAPPTSPPGGSGTALAGRIERRNMVEGVGMARRATSPLRGLTGSA